MKKFAALLLIAVLFTLSAAFAACGKTHSVEPELGTNLAAGAEVSATDNGEDAYKAADGETLTAEGTYSGDTQDKTYITGKENSLDFAFSLAEGGLYAVPSPTPTTPRTETIRTTWSLRNATRRYM